jgi:hypothetical protein
LTTFRAEVVETVGKLSEDQKGIRHSFKWPRQRIDDECGDRGGGVFFAAHDDQ